ncbi:hypothetical protein K493DRAFT_308628 [Basidiobolus meristosporus CBS 931.73]|uniref:Uncharacterized protein n=1 Tax=Basidiobolus meristosporus CBS 931.73 TaxID=1314790 RepID=A0A1Y1X0M6_9FUNG|nr:hypothetical protein K493DRAFT_308628 [Basidiobolus meristosporus CBS 931.73]|eukprot:ORX78884.1 hypothetical protein K493DRAFT_308628 [Basidiobolus meristosporus CBS 931.73]
MSMMLAELGPPLILLPVLAACMVLTLLQTRQQGAGESVSVPTMITRSKYIFLLASQQGFTGRRTFVGDNGEVVTIQQSEVVEEYENHKSLVDAANNLCDNLTS